MSRLRQIAEYDPSVQKDKVHPQKDENLTNFGQTTAELDRFNLQWLKHVPCETVSSSGHDNDMFAENDRITFK